MLRQTLKVIPNGVIESGSAKLSIDEVKGLIDEVSVAVVGVSIFNKTLTDHSDFKIDPNLLKSASITDGLQLSFGVVSIHVDSVANKVAAVSIVVKSPDLDLKGPASIDLSGPYISIMHILLNGTASGMSVTLELEQ